MFVSARETRSKNEQQQHQQVIVDSEWSVLNRISVAAALWLCLMPKHTCHSRWLIFLSLLTFWPANKGSRPNKWFSVFKSIAMNVRGHRYGGYQNNAQMNGWKKAAFSTQFSRREKSQLNHCNCYLGELCLLHPPMPAVFLLLYLHSRKQPWKRATNGSSNSNGDE